MSAVARAPVPIAESAEVAKDVVLQSEARHLSPSYQQLGLHLLDSGTHSSERRLDWQRRVGPASAVPMLQRPDLLDLVRRRGWQALLQHAEVRDEFRQNCGECMHWCSTPSGLKVHMTHSHPRWTQEQDSILARAALLRRVVTKPWQYCLADRFDKQQHWSRCPTQ